MKRLLIIAGLILLFGVTILSFLPGYGPAENDYRDESADVIGPLSYFKTPQSAVTLISQLLVEENWQKLSQFYEQGMAAPRRTTLQDGSHFQLQSPDLTRIRPFAPDYVWLETRVDADEDIYEIVVGTNGTEGPVALKHLYLKRYPSGYRIVAQRPSSDTVNSD